MRILKAFVRKYAYLVSVILCAGAACLAMSVCLLTYRALMFSAPPQESVDPFSSSDLSLVRPAGITYELERDILAKFIYSIAPSEPYVCQVSLGATIVNRTEDARFSGDITSVIFDCSPFFDRSMLSVSPSERSVNAARDALSGIDPSGGAIYFFKSNDTEALVLHKNRITASFGSYSFSK